MLRKLLFILLFLCSSVVLYAQQDSDERGLLADSLRKEAPVVSYATPENLQDTLLGVDEMSKKERRTLEKGSREFGVHSPHRATIYAMVCPGLGQIYNKQYWKLPILYGGVALAIYGVTWNNKAYIKYRDAHYDLSNYIDSLSVNPMYPYPEDPAWEKIKIVGTDWKTLFELRPSSMTRYQAIMYNKRRRFKRNRDMCYLALAGVYALNVIDACVSAHFFDFTINDDLSFHWQPDVSFNHRTGKANYRASVSLNF